MRLKLLALFFLTAIGLTGCDISPEDHRGQFQLQVKARVNLAETIAVRAGSQSMHKRFLS